MFRCHGVFSAACCVNGIMSFVIPESIVPDDQCWTWRQRNWCAWIWKEIGKFLLNFFVKWSLVSFRAVQGGVILQWGWHILEQLIKSMWLICTLYMKFWYWIISLSVVLWDYGIFFLVSRQVNFYNLIIKIEHNKNFVNWQK